MAKRRVKKRTHIPHTNGIASAPGNTASKPGSRAPKSMVIRIGASAVGPAVSQLVRDVRSVLEPQTAARLKERRGNKLRDFTTMAGPLGVTHLLLFSRSEPKVGRSGNVNMRLAVTPRGPTMHFRVEGYSLCKDVMKVQKRPKGKPQGEFLAPPLLVMNNFSSKPQDETEAGKKGGGNAVPKNLESLATTVFQSLFPPINPTHTPLNSIKRVLLLDRKTAPSSTTPDDDSSHPYVLNLRHYAITTRTAKSVAKPLRRLDAAEKISHAGQKRRRAAVPNLGKLHDVADYLLDQHAADGFTSASDSEPDTDAEVEVLAPAQQRVRDRREKKKDANEADEDADGRPAGRPDRAQARVERKGIKLQELGPRLRLRLTKLEEGMCGGKVMWHEYIRKSDQEVKQMEKVHDARRKERERRRDEQKANVERKKRKRQANGQAEDDEDEEGLDEDGDMWDDYEDDEEMMDVDGEVDDGGVEVGADEDGSDDDEDEVQ